MARGSTTRVGSTREKQVSPTACQWSFPAEVEGFPGTFRCCAYEHWDPPQEDAPDSTRFDI
eukprot:1909955-Rhodomonas_salina.2